MASRGRPEGHAHEILWLKADLLLPLDKGGKLRTWHLMRHLARRHEITYLSFAGRDADRRRSSTACARSRARVVTVPRPSAARARSRFYADAAAHLVDPLPYAVGQVPVARLPRAASTQLLARERFDLVVCDFLAPAVNLPERLPCPAVLFTHNVEAEIWRRHAETQATDPSRSACTDAAVAACCASKARR